jgi:uncharacterized membrane protein YedE/YeeE
MTRGPWYVAGPLLGLTIIVLRAALNKPLGVLGGYIDFAHRAIDRRPIGVGAWLLLGFVLGGAAYAVSAGTFSISFTYAGFVWPTASLWIQVAVLALAGIAMGFGARTAGGCTSGHGLSGMSLGSPASVVASLMFFGAGVALAHVLARL